MPIYKSLVSGLVGTQLHPTYHSPVVCAPVMQLFCNHQKIPSLLPTEMTRLEELQVTKKKSQVEQTNDNWVIHASTIAVIYLKTENSACKMKFSNTLRALWCLQTPEESSGSSHLSHHFVFHHHYRDQRLLWIHIKPIGPQKWRFKLSGERIVTFNPSLQHLSYCLCLFFQSQLVTTF